MVRSLIEREHVVLGLELDTDTEGLSCAGKAAVPPSWARSKADGRSSSAMRDLVCGARKLEARGKLTIVYLDGPKRTRDFDAKAKDYFGAELTRKTGAVGVILVGNYHARNAEHSLAGELRTAGYHVTTFTASSPNKKSFAWQCQQDGCGVKGLMLDLCPNTRPAGAFRWTPSSDPRWDRCFIIPRLSGSPPFDG